MLKLVHAKDRCFRSCLPPNVKATIMRWPTSYASAACIWCISHAVLGAIRAIASACGVAHRLRRWSTGRRDATHGGGDNDKRNGFEPAPGERAGDGSSAFSAPGQLGRWRGTDPLPCRPQQGFSGGRRQLPYHPGRQVGGELHLHGRLCGEPARRGRDRLHDGDRERPRPHLRRRLHAVQAGPERGARHLRGRHGGRRQ